MRPIDADDFATKIKYLAELSKTKLVELGYLIEMLKSQPTMDLRGQIHAEWEGDFVSTCSNCGW